MTPAQGGGECITTSGTWGKGVMLSIDNRGREIHHFLDEIMIWGNNRSAEVFWCRLGRLCLM